MKFNKEIHLYFSELDNEPLEGVMKGWVTNFHKFLSTLLSQISRDTVSVKLISEENIDSTSIDDTAVVIAICTPAFTASPELTATLNTYAKKLKENNLLLSEGNLMIRESFSEEDQKNYNNIFMLLSMIYDPQNVALVRENILMGSTDSITFAVEMLDIFVEEELKPKLIPVLDELKVDERLARLLNYFPPEDFESYYDLLLQIINRDYNRIDRYTKALAMYRIASIDEAEISDDLIANLFNPDVLLKQTAAFTMYRLNQEAYHYHTKRLQPYQKKELDKAILPPVFREEGEDYHQKLLLIERVLLLKEVPEFKKVPGELITYIAEVLDEIIVQEGTTLVDSDDTGSIPCYIVLEGVVDIYQNDQKVEERSRAGLVGHENLLSDNHFDYVGLTRGACTLLVLRKEELMDLMSRHVEIMEAYLDILNREVGEEEEESVSDVLLSF